MDKSDRVLQYKIKFQEKMIGYNNLPRDNTNKLSGINNKFSSLKSHLIQSSQ